MHSWSDRWKEEGIQQGVQRGLWQGHEKSVLNLLTAKFGTDAAKAVEPRLQETSIEQLQTWMTRILTAETIEDVFRVSK